LKGCLVLFFVSATTRLFAQSPDTVEIDWSRYDYIPGQQTLFYDDFSGDREGEAPSAWTVNPNGKAAVVKVNDRLWLQAREEATLSPAQLKLTPQFTVEMDFYVFAEGYSGRYRIDLIGKTAEEWASLTLEPQAIFFSLSTGLTSEKLVDLRSGPHHLAMQVDGGGFKCYVDFQQVINIPKSGTFSATKIEVFMPGAGDDANDNQCRFTNFWVAQGPTTLQNQLTASGKIVSYGLYFERGAANLLPASTPVLEQLAELLQTDATLSFSVECHDNEREEQGDNARLSEARAEAIKDELVQQYRINSSRLSSRGWGEGKPLAERDTVEGRKMNQRVEFIRK
jgi:outer membrane protein OmpA-like peptidoglycan-associated protein